MEIEFDPEKDRKNRAKHGISLDQAAQLDMASASVIPDERRDYGEARFRAYAFIGGRMHMLVFTMRDGVVRAISLRKANPKEVRRHG